MRFLKSEAGAVVLWLVATILTAAGLFPWIYKAGKSLAARAANHEVSGILESIGKSAQKAEIGTYFSRSLYAAVLLLVPILVFRLLQISKTKKDEKPAENPFRLTWKPRLLQFLGAVLLAAGLLWVLGISLQAAGAFVADTTPAKFGKVFQKAFFPAVFAAVIEELLFRGLLLGVWLRIAKPATALLSVSAVFAFVHFLQPPAGTSMANPAAPLAGFELLGLVFRHFLNPQFIAAEFLLLFVVGMILGATRLRTGSLWFPIGLHAGWIFAFKAFNMLHENAPSPLRPLWIGDSLRSVLLPVFTLLVTAAVCHFTLRCPKAPEEIPRS